MASPRIVHVSMECLPFSKVGGMADVVGSLPAALRELGASCRVMTPHYPQLHDGRIDAEIAAFDVWVGDSPHRVRLLEAGDDVLVDQPAAFDRPGVYDDPHSGEGFSDSLYRCLVLQQAARIAVRDGHVPADVVHCHDNHTGLLPVFLKDDGGPPSVFTIHNLAYQGRYGADEFWITGLSEDRFFGHSAFEFHGDLSLMKAGLSYADKITTVSPSYAEEILSPDFGHGLEGVLQHRRDDLCGILNGIDEDYWNPGRDPALPAHYSVAEREGKEACKRALCEEGGIEYRPGVPLIGMVSRVTHQKGLDLVGAILPHLLRREASIVLLGSGDAEILDLFRGARGRWPERVALFEGYNEALSHRVYAGSDIFMMPSRFEPCGLSQLYAMRYGAVPVVTSVGGLKDTVQAFEEEWKTGTGVRAHWATSDSFQGAVDYALDLYEKPKLFKRVQGNGMKLDFSWTRSAEQYLALYRGLMGESAPDPAPEAEPETGPGADA